MSVTVSNFRLEAALCYAEMGWKVFPLFWPRISPTSISCACDNPECSSIGKHPITHKGLHDASSDPEVIREWWRKWPSANVGVATGAVSKFIVLDVDPDKGGEASFEKLIRDHQSLPETVEQVTGSGGRHYLFAHPGRKIPNSNSKIAPGLDVRGDGGYIVVPPSMHLSRNRYDWKLESAPEDLGLALAPNWLLELMAPIERRPAPVTQQPSSDSGSYWLGKALAKAIVGNRNATGHWLACQLRDNGMTESEAAGVLSSYADRVPRSDKAYTQREALASLRQAYSQPAREPARNLSRPARVSHPAPATPAAPPADAATELEERLHGIIDGRIYNVHFPWSYLTSLTQALLPGSITVICGDPGVGKTFFVLQALRFWHGNAIPSAVFFIEKDRVFHTHRLLAQLEGKGHFVDYEWIQFNGDAVKVAMARNRQYIAEIGKFIHSSPAGRLTLQNMIAWMNEQCTAGARVLVIDPITAIDAGAERWTADEDFMLAAQATLRAHGASLVLITHPKKGWKGSSSAHEQGGGAAYFRFSDTNLWISRKSEEENVGLQTKCGPHRMDLKYFFQLHKTRDGKGAGLEIGLTFEELMFAEQGIVTE